MKPYFEEKDCCIFLGDAAEVLPRLMDEREGIVFGMLLTDPPYGLGGSWQGGTWGSKAMYAKDARRWDDVPPKKELIDLAISSAVDCVIWGGNYFNLPPSRCWLVWRKSPKMETLSDAELAWTNLERPAKVYESSRNPDGAKMHPTQKPLSLMKWCLKFSEGSVLDIFCGSGTTLRAAKDMGRKVVGIEINEKYAEIAANRLRQKVLF